MRTFTRLGLLMALTLPAALAAQDAQQERQPDATSDTSVARFLMQARAGTRRYEDRAAAILDGYRRIGPDFPGMGEHWIQVGLAFRNQLDAARPAVLQYVVIAGTPRLVGVAYILPLLGGESPPHFPSMHAWHDHTGTVDDESLLLDQVATDHDSTSGARIVMLHAWIGLDNPAGVFVSDNWTLPFVRAGLPVPSSAPSASAGRAMSLLSGGDVFYTALAQVMGRPGPADSARIRDTVAQYRREVADLVRRRTGATLGATDLAALGAIWERLWSAVAATVQPDVRTRLAPIAAP